MSDSEYRDLANAIILQAVSDYRRCVKRHTRKFSDPQAQREREDIERFFRSGWFQALTNIDGSRLLSDLEQEMEGSA